ncbi:hypothetical protein OF83DRAFT_1117445 [Amylostereum chailletii]|nr:hypothetical protein OF83DRAFT_1117445 [Amylostereum chailletii]
MKSLEIIGPGQPGPDSGRVQTEITPRCRDSVNHIDRSAVALDDSSVDLFPECNPSDLLVYSHC